MKASQEIREALARVAELRHMASEQGALAQTLKAVKCLQEQRFSGTYADLLVHPVFAPSAKFFLDELYSANDFHDRDAQFSRIAGALERTFPESVMATVLALAKLHLRTEELDMAMARHWSTSHGQSDATRYLLAWRAVGQRAERHWQLATVLDIGQALGRLTRKPGLRLMLKMMRRPAELAGLGSLQAFLESGFDHFSGMSRGGHVDAFLGTIGQRESGWINRLFDTSLVTCETELTQTLGFAPTAEH